MKIVNKSMFDIDGKPSIIESIPLGLQHVVAMIVGNIAPLLIISRVLELNATDTTLLVQCALVASGLATIIQLYPIKIGKNYRIGARLPVIMGVSFGFLPTCLAIGNSYGISGILGAQIVGGIVSIFVGVWIKKIRIFFPPIVAGTVVISIGLSLFPVAINYMAGGIGSPEYGSPLSWVISLTVLVVVLYFNQFTKGFTSLSSILLGMIVGYIICLFMGIVDFTPVKNATWFALPKPLNFGITFKADAMIAMIIMYIVTAIQAVGDLSATTIGGLGREVTDEELSGGVIGNGVAAIVSAMMNSLPTATYSQNVGLVVLTKVVSRFVLAIGIGFLFIAGLVPKFGAIMTTIPQAVIGGGTITVFSMITMTGIKLITREELTGRNAIIVGLSIALGVGIVQVPNSIAQFSDSFKMIFGGSSVVIATLTALTLNLIFPKPNQKKEESKIKLANEEGE